MSTFMAIFAIFLLIAMAIRGIRRIIHINTVPRIPYEDCDCDNGLRLGFGDTPFLSCDHCDAGLEQHRALVNAMIGGV
jgi:hypothetical protein